MKNLHMYICILMLCSVVYFTTPIIMGYYIMEATNGMARKNVLGEKKAEERN